MIAAAAQAVQVKTDWTAFALFLVALTALIGGAVRFVIGRIDRWTGALTVRLNRIDAHLGEQDVKIARIDERTRPAGRR